MAKDSPERTSNTAILLAGGSGTRMQGTVEDKTLALIAGLPAIAHSVKAFNDSRVVDHIVVVHRDDQQKSSIEPLLNGATADVTWAQGGTERMNSVWAGLQAAPEDTRFVFIHDCARPCVTPQAIQQLAEKAKISGAACLAHPITDTIKKASPENDGFALKTLDRSTLWGMETPQAFCFGLIFAGYTKAIGQGTPITDDLSAIEDQNIPVTLIQNGRPNPKITNPSDLDLIETILSKAP